MSLRSSSEPSREKRGLHPKKNEIVPGREKAITSHKRREGRYFPALYPLRESPYSLTSRLAAIA